MIIIQLYLAFLCSLADAVKLHEDTECQHLVNKLDGTVGANEVCLIFVPRGSYVHLNITTKNPENLVVDGVFCYSESTKDVRFDVEYKNIDSVHFSYIAANETCPLDNVGIMQMVMHIPCGFICTGAYSETEFSVEVTENYEKIPTEFLNEFRIILITCFGIVFILLLVFLCCYKFVDYKFISRLRATENELEQIRHNQISQGIELSVLSKNELDHSANLEPSDHSDNSMYELISHSP